MKEQTDAVAGQVEETTSRDLTWAHRLLRGFRLPDGFPVPLLPREDLLTEFAEAVKATVRAEEHQVIARVIEAQMEANYPNEDNYLTLAKIQRNAARKAAIAVIRSTST